MAVNVSYVSCGCNWSRHSADWGQNDVICFAACNSVALWEPQIETPGSVASTVCQHSKEVNSVRWIRNHDSKETAFLSTSSDSTAVIWRKSSEGLFKPTCSLKGHVKDAIVGDGLVYHTRDSKDFTVIATASIDSTVNIWHGSEDGSFHLFQTLNLITETCLDVRVCCLPNSFIPLVICASTDCVIYLYAQVGNEYVKVGVLRGHEDFVRAVDITSTDSGDVLIASGDQAGQIRIWRLCSLKCGPTTSAEPAEDYKPEAMSFSVMESENMHHFSISVESVILAHDGMVNGLHWHPKLTTGNSLHQPLKLLSCSMDKSMILWEPEAQSGVWLECVRVGEIGGNCAGFYGCKFGPQGKRILAYSKQGSFHLWCLDESTGCWEAQVSVSGHLNDVVDIQWEPDGEYLLSVSRDQTTRLHAQWRRDDGKASWHEIARPQVHGHDMSCVAVLSRYKFASGSEEKVGRVFEAPKNFIENFHRICKLKEDNDYDTSIPQGALVPSLGLSNKAVFLNQEEKPVEKSDYPEPVFNAVELHEPPTEEQLMQNTLWPEVQKLYGHGYEVFCMAASHNGRWLASACKSTSLQHSAIILWDTKSWKLSQKLESHSLTVTQMAFSPDDRFLLSVSRDRQWSLFERVKSDSSDSYQLVATSQNIKSSHSRIIWSCAWSHDSKYFVTTSREGKVNVWGTDDGLEWKNPKMWPLKLQESVTAAAFACHPAHGNSDERYLIALGTEGGSIHLYTWQPTLGNEMNWKHVNALNNDIAHHKTVRRLVFRPCRKSSHKQDFQLASCGADHMVKIYNVTLI